MSICMYARTRKPHNTYTHIHTYTPSHTQPRATAQQLSPTGLHAQTPATDNDQRNTNHNHQHHTGHTDSVTISPPAAGLL